MPAKGRPRLTEQDLLARIASYCERYGVVPGPSGLPPFPTGRRETPQHREWIAVYKAHNRLGRRGRGQCERCAAPASDGSVFCDEHRARVVSGRGAVDHASLADRQAMLDAQQGRCPVCGAEVELWDSVDHGHPSGVLRGVLHPSCNRLVGLVESLGLGCLERVRAYLGPEAPPRRRRGG